MWLIARHLSTRQRSCRPGAPFSRPSARICNPRNSQYTPALSCSHSASLSPSLSTSRSLSDSFITSSRSPRYERALRNGRSQPQSATPKASTLIAASCNQPSRSLTRREPCRCSRCRQRFILKPRLKSIVFYFNSIKRSFYGSLLILILK